MMSSLEYLQLLEKSLSFKALDTTAQDAVRNAQGEERESWVKTFQEEAEIVAKAYLKLADKTEKIVLDLKYDSEKNKKAKLAKAEEIERAGEIDSVGNLLQNL
jgi:hypothetical protein